MLALALISVVLFAGVFLVSFALTRKQRSAAFKPLPRLQFEQVAIQRQVTDISAARAKLDDLLQQVSEMDQELGRLCREAA